MDELEALAAAFTDGDYPAIKEIVRDLRSDLYGARQQRDALAEILAFFVEPVAIKERRSDGEVYCRYCGTRFQLDGSVTHVDGCPVSAAARAIKSAPMPGSTAARKIDAAIERVFENVSGVWCLSPDDPERPALIRWLRKNLYQAFDVGPDVAQEGQE